MRTQLVALCLCASLIGSGVAAQQAPAAAATEKRDEKEDDPSKFFWFHKAGVAPADAKTDIQYCLAQTSTIRAKQQPSTGQGGLIGALVEGIIKGVVGNVEERRMRDAGMRKCMGLYGYSRYQVPEPEWNAMMRAEDAVDRLTLFTSGTAPSTERLSR